MHELSISFIIPVYNTPEVLLRRCIDSIAKAADTVDYETLIVDDGSTETDVKAIVSSYGDARLRYFRQDNARQGAARNRGLDNAEKEWVQFVDSDDFLIADNYRQIIDIAADEQPDAVMFRYRNVTDAEPSVNVSPGRIVCRTSGVDYLTDNSALGVVWNCLIRRSRLQGLRFRQDIFIEDEEYMPLMMLRLNTLTVTDVVAYAYYRHTDSTTGKRSADHIEKTFADFLAVIANLCEVRRSLDGKPRRALTRCIDQDCVAFAYNLLRRAPDGKFFRRWLDRLFDEGVLPAPKARYNIKYTLARFATAGRRRMRLLRLIFKAL